MNECLMLVPHIWWLYGCSG